MAPAYLANMTPPFMKYWKGWNPPISRRWLGALVFAAPWARLGVDDIIAILAVSFVGDIAVNHTAYLLGIRDSKW